MLDYSLFVKNVHKKVKIAGMIGLRYLKNIKQACFNRLAKNLYVNKPQSFQVSVK
jgi:hypothetical protein